MLDKDRRKREEEKTKVSPAKKPRSSKVLVIIMSFTLIRGNVKSKLKPFLLLKQIFSLFHF